MRKFFLKYVVIAWVFTLLSASCQSKPKTTSEVSDDLYSIEFKDTMHHFGIIHQENPIDSFDFEFTNTGTTLIVILAARTSCKCTAVKYLPKPIKPGDTSYVRVIYDGTGRNPEYFNKSVFIYTNASDKELQLRFDGVLQ